MRAPSCGAGLARSARAEQDRHAFGAQGFDTAAETELAGQGGVDERQDHDGTPRPGGIGKDARGMCAHLGSAQGQVRGTAACR